MPHSALSSSEDLNVYSDPLTSNYAYDARRGSADSAGYDPTELDSRRESGPGSLAHYNPRDNVSVDSITRYARHTPQSSLSATYPPSTSAEPCPSTSAASAPGSTPLSPSQATPHTPTRRSRARAFSFLQPHTPASAYAHPHAGSGEDNPFESDAYHSAFELGHDDDDDEDEEGEDVERDGYGGAEVSAGARRYRTSFQRLSRQEVGWMVASGGVVLGLAGVAVVLVAV